MHATARGARRRRVTLKKLFVETYGWLFFRKHRITESIRAAPLLLLTAIVIFVVEGAIMLLFIFLNARWCTWPLRRRESSMHPYLSS